MADRLMDLAEHVEHFRWRILQDALAEATSAYWQRRARAFAKVGSPEADATALACRRHASLLRAAGLDAEASELIAEVLRRSHLEAV